MELEPQKQTIKRESDLAQPPCVIFLPKSFHIVFFFWKGVACNLSTKTIGLQSVNKNFRMVVHTPSPWKTQPLGSWTIHMRGWRNLWLPLLQYVWRMGLGICLFDAWKKWKNIHPNGWFNGDLPWYFGKRPRQKNLSKGTMTTIYHLPIFMYTYICDLYILYFFCPLMFFCSTDISHQKLWKNTTDSLSQILTVWYYGIFTSIWMVLGLNVGQIHHTLSIWVRENTTQVLNLPCAKVEFRGT